MTLLLVAAPTYLLRCVKPTSINDLARHRLVVMRSNTSAQLFAWEFAGKGGSVERLEITPHFIVNDPAGLLKAALLGMGICQLGSNLALPPIIAGQLVQLLPETMVRSRGLYAAYLSRRFTPRKVTLLVQALTEAFAQLK